LFFVIRIGEFVNLDLVLSNFIENLFLKVRTLIRGHCVSLGQDWDDVDFVMETLHELDIQRLETVTRWLDEIEADVNSIVAHRLPEDPGFCVQVLFVLGFDIVDDRLPALKIEEQV